MQGLFCPRGAVSGSALLVPPRLQDGDGMKSPSLRGSAGMSLFPHRLFQPRLTQGGQFLLSVLFASSFFTDRTPELSGGGCGSRDTPQQGGGAQLCAPPPPAQALGMGTLAGEGCV